MTRPPEFDRPLGAPKGLAARSSYIYAREFTHASVKLDIEKQTGVITWHKTETVTKSIIDSKRSRIALPL